MPDGAEARFEERIPTADEHLAVAAAVGWTDHFDPATIGDALDRSLHGVVATIDGDVVGVGRLVGDGVRYCYVQDVMVRPDAADRGIATGIVERLVGWVRDGARSEAIVGLFASPEAIDVYRGIGFAEADGDPLGMTLRIPAG